MTCCCFCPSGDLGCDGEQCPAFSASTLHTHDKHHGLSSDAKVVDFPAVPFLFLFHLAIATVGLLEMAQVTLLGKLKGKGCWRRQRNGRPVTQGSQGYVCVLSFRGCSTSG